MGTLPARGEGGKVGDERREAEACDEERRDIEEQGRRGRKRERTGVNIVGWRIEAKEN